MFTSIQYRQSILSVANHYRELERRFAWLPPYSVEDGYLLYKNAYQASLGFLVCGRTRINGPRQRVEGSSIEEIDLYNLGATNHSSENADIRASFTGRGSVLHYNSNWHFLLNDSWLLGGIHANHEFHLASPRHMNNLIDSNASGRFLTVMGRELIGLLEFGYAFKKVGYMGQEIAVCFDKQKAKQADFARYWQAIDRQENGAKLDNGIVDRAAQLQSPSTEDVANWQKSVPGSKF